MPRSYKSRFLTAPDNDKSSSGPRCTQPEELGSLDLLTPSCTAAAPFGGNA